METVAQSEPVQGRVAWKKFAMVLIPGLAAAGALGVATAEGAIAASFAVSGDSFKVSADKLEGTGFAQYGDVSTSKDGTGHPVAISAIGDATLTNLCQSVLMDTPVGEVTLVIKAGQGDTPVEADNLVVDAEQLSGNATFGNIEIGRDASTLDEVEGATGEAGAFGQQAETVTITNLQQTAWAVNAGTFKLSGLDLSMKPGNHECF